MSDSTSNAASTIEPYRIETATIDEGDTGAGEGDTGAFAFAGGDGGERDR